MAIRFTEDDELQWFPYNPYKSMLTQFNRDIIEYTTGKQSNGKLLSLELSYDGENWTNLITEKETQLLKITLPNGITVEGTHVQVVDVANKLGFTNVFAGKYFSNSSGAFVDIKTMPTTHIENALRRITREYADNLSKFSGEKLVTALEEGPQVQEYHDLLSELDKRTGVPF